ncbi:YebC/PmpR family DNA-binding transcriptional regulator [Blattabacterium cuenoti]|uniref:YebC/PmpR family DNA-binding transcriptional regulator n=1 Tax=Blattabacterium cuenoti TaxID=1653831 RepID=UPI00163BFB8D|nr:YebC/PmpR family DNA-binding transcriptional regulator [Blattabacterium cuenoti]
MSGHSKWANIQHRKSNQDIKKSKKFSKAINEIISIVKKWGINNYRLKNAIINAKSLNIPKNTIKKAIQKILNSKTNNYKNINIEGKIYGISIIIECITDNNIRTLSIIKTIFNKNGGLLCNNGELLHFFIKKLFFFVKKKDIINISLEDLELKLIDVGAEDIIEKEKEIHIIIDFKYFGCIKQNLEKLKIKYKSILKRIPKQKKYISNDKKQKILSLIKDLNKNDEIKNIYYNVNL